MRIEFYFFERIYCRIVGHDWCHCRECEGGSYSHCKRCKGHRSPATIGVLMPPDYSDIIAEIQSKLGKLKGIL